MDTKVNRAFYTALDTMLLAEHGALPTGSEDSFVRALGVNAALVGVFDGCGGLGSRVYAELDGRTGAYIAARIASGAVYDWFQTLRDLQELPAPDELTASLRSHLDEALKIAASRGAGASRMRGSMVRDFPTTAAVALAHEADGSILLDLFWAGDSRVYLLDAAGLAQLTHDDLAGQDALSNLSNDAALTNVISSDGNYTLHHTRIALEHPALIIAATDGVFGYVRTPMELEWLLLRVIAKAETPDLFRRQIQAVLGEIAEDDFALNLMSFYHGSWDTLRSISYVDRAKELEHRYIRPLMADRTDAHVQALWEIGRAHV